MCKLKSAIILKDRIFMPDYDSHSRMLEELGIRDDYFYASKTFVRAELSPATGDPFSGIDGWELTVDQDITPDWFDAEDCRARMREAVREWAKTHIFIGVDNLKISSGENYYIKDCHDVVVCGNATIQYVRGNATIQSVYDNATIQYVCGNATIQYVRGNATIQSVYDNATIQYVCGNATIQSSSVWKWYKSDSVILCDNATFKNKSTKTIYQAGDWKLVTVSGKGEHES